MDFQLEETRLSRALDRIAKQKIIVKTPEPPNALLISDNRGRDEGEADEREIGG